MSAHDGERGLLAAGARRAVVRHLLIEIRASCATLWVARGAVLPVSLHNRHESAAGEDCR
jgi:hypothetical protein